MEQNANQGIINQKSEILSKLYEAYPVLQQAYSCYYSAEEQKNIAAKKASTKKKYLIWFIVVLVLTCFTMSANATTLVYLVILALLGFGSYRARKGMIEAEERARKLMEEGDNILTVHQDKIDFLASEYQNPKAVEYIIKYIQDDRADTLREAYKLYDDQCMKWAMQHQAEVQTEHLKAIRKGTNVAAAASTISAVRDVRDMFRGK